MPYCSVIVILLRAGGSVEPRDRVERPHLREVLPPGKQPRACVPREGWVCITPHHFLRVVGELVCHRRAHLDLVLDRRRRLPRVARL